MSAAGNNLQNARRVDITNAVVFGPRLVVLLTLVAHPLWGGVVLDGSFGRRGALPGPNFLITAPMGKQVGGNLFESFSQFNLNSSQSATFTGPANVHNILARVTSGSSSSIDGTVNSSIDGANLFFLNPAGVIFGANAQINVSGSFAVSTANYLNLADGGKFNTSLGGRDVLTSAPVSAFGFLSAAPARVSITGSTLNPPLQKSFSVVAGDITMNGGRISGAGSRMNLVSVKSPGEAKLDATDLNSALDVTRFTTMGTIDITNLAQINTSGNPRLGVQLGGPVFIRAGKFFLNNQSVISSRSFFGSLNRVSKIDVQAHDVKILDGSRISAPTSGSANAGHIRINADSLLRIDAQGTGLTTGLLALSDQESSRGNGGEVRVTAGHVEIFNGGEISAYTAGMGDGGMVKVKADSLVIKGTGRIGPGFSPGIFADARTRDGGDITVIARDLEITGGGEISTGSFGEGSGGSITVTATHSLVIDGTGSEEGLIAPPKDEPNPVSGNTSVFHGTSILALGYGSGNGGNITLNAPLLSVVGGGQIAAATFGTGNGGTVNLTSDSVLIDGKGALENVLFGTGVFADARGRSGNGGEIIVAASDAIITAGGQIAASTFGAGHGGKVELTAKNSLLIHGSDSGIFAVAGFAGLANSGDGGDVIVSTGDLSLQNRGAISAASFTSGNAGSVQLGRIGTLSMDSGSSISSANTGSGDGGSVTINTTGPVTVKDGSSISTESTVGNAGDIKLTSGGEIKLKDQSSITASAGVNGGNITITAPEQLVYLVDSSITATAGTTGGSGTGGNITIDHPQFIVASNSLISANATVGTAGNVLLNSDFLFSSNSTIFATGTINITAPSLDLGAQLITLPTSLLSAASQLQERCTALLQEDFSSFISIGRGGTEPAPEELQEEF